MPSLSIDNVVAVVVRRKYADTLAISANHSVSESAHSCLRRGPMDPSKVSAPNSGTARTSRTSHRFAVKHKIVCAIYAYVIRTRRAREVKELGAQRTNNAGG